jgi:hypothetical protein
LNVDSQSLHTRWLLKCLNSELTETISSQCCNYNHVKTIKTWSATRQNDQVEEKKRDENVIMARFSIRLVDKSAPSSGSWRDVKCVALIFLLEWRVGSCFDLIHMMIISIIPTVNSFDLCLSSHSISFHRIFISTSSWLYHIIIIFIFLSWSRSHPLDHTSINQL